MKLTSDHSFPDTEITYWLLTNDVLEIKISNVIYDGHQQGPTSIHFPLAKPATAMFFDNEANEWKSEAQVESLKSICEFHHKLGSIYSLKGFGVNSGKWLAIHIISKNADISWD